MKFRNVMFSLISAFAIVITAGCGAQSTSESAGSTVEQSVSEEAEALESEKPSGDIAEYDSDSLNLALDTTIEETTLFDDGSVCVKAKELSFSYNSPVLTIEITNNADKKLQFTAGTLGYSCNSVNGTMVESGYLNAEVAPGKSTIEEVRFDADELKIYGIKEIAEIKFGVMIEDEDYQDYAVVMPVSIPTSAYDKWDHTSDHYQTALHSGLYQNEYGIDVLWEDQETLFDAESVKIVSSALLKNTDGETSLLLEIENTSDEILNAVISDIEVNGLMLCSGTWTGDTIDQQSKCITSIDVDDAASYGAESLEAIGISEIASIGFCVEIEDTNHNTLKTGDVTVNITGEEKQDSFPGKEVYADNGIEIVLQNISDSDSRYYNALFVVSNNTKNVVNVDVEYDSLSLNDMMTDSINYSLTLKPDKRGVLRVRINKDDAEKAGIASLSDIKNMELVFKIRDNQTYNDIDSPNVKISF